MSAGKISHRSFTHVGKMDQWTYSFSVKSLRELQKSVSGTLRLSVPIANIHERTFKVWFVFGVKNVKQHVDLGKAVSQSNNDSNVSADPASNDSSSTTSSSGSQNSNAQAKSAPKKTKVNNPAAPKEKTVIADDLARYRVSPKKQVYSDIALVDYPFLPVSIVFLVLAIMIISGAIILRRKVLRGERR